MPEALQLKAQILQHLGVMSVQQYHLQKGLAQLRNALQLWQRLHDGEQQFRTLLNISEVYHHAFTVNGHAHNSAESVECIQRAKRLLTPQMDKFRELTGVYYQYLGGMYYKTDQYEPALDAMVKSVESLDSDDTQWAYYYGKQYVGRIRSRLGQYDDAYALLESSIASNRMRPKR